MMHLQCVDRHLLGNNELAQHSEYHRSSREAAHLDECLI